MYVEIYNADKQLRIITYLLSALLSKGMQQPEVELLLLQPRQLRLFRPKRHALHCSTFCNVLFVSIVP